MNCGRRSFFGTIVLALGAAALAAAQAQPSGQGGRPRKIPPDLGSEPLAKTDPRALLRANQKDIKRDVERLFELVQELKKEVEKTDASEVLSLTVVRKAEEIEKLAKHVKRLARG